MNRKGKLTISIIAMVLVAFFVGWGIWSVFQDIGIGVDVSFSGENMTATITGKMYGHNKDHMTSDTAEQLDGATWTDGVAEDTHFLDWSNLELNFTDAFSDIIIQIFIYNGNAETPINISVENKTETEGKNFTVAIDQSGTSTQDLIGVGETIEYTITLKIVNPNLRVDGTLDVIFSLVNAG